ncbi:NADH:flavin oxidoreductase [Gammaproteobacteria bacterium]|nr:NADH:flavin oxidoreductase [Gammaproteobacteria bacterium]
MNDSKNVLFSEYNLNGLKLRNRIVMAPMTRSFSPKGVPADYAPSYYAKRAAGGVGLIITEGVEVSHRAASGYLDVPNLESDASKFMWEKVVSAVHENVSPIFCQLWHVGGIRKLGMPPSPEIPGFTPSGCVKPGKKVAYEMTEADIEELIEIYANDAKICEELGFDGVEIHGAHGYLIDQFFWDAINTRTDQFGGSLENRARFASNIIQQSQKKTSSEFQVGMRISQWKQQDYEAKITSDKDELNLFLNILKNAGADFLHCSNRRFWEGEFSEDGLNLAGIAKKTTGLPSISVGSVGVDKDFIKLYAGDHQTQTTDLDKLHERLNKSEFDLIAVGRALLSDPEWANKVQNGQEKDIIPFDKSFVENYV